LSVVSPTRAPLGGGVELAPLAAKVIDQWYRRGYAGLLTRMNQIRDTVTAKELAGHWENLTGHQQRAEELWLTKRDELAKLWHRTERHEVGRPCTPTTYTRRPGTCTTTKA
jgi:hypothetical protein